MSHILTTVSLHCKNPSNANLVWTQHWLFTTLDTDWWQPQQTSLPVSPFISMFLPTNQKMWWGQQPAAFLSSPCTAMEISHYHWGFACLPGDVCKVIGRAAVNILDNYIWLLMLTICYFVIKTRACSSEWNCFYASVTPYQMSCCCVAQQSSHVLSCVHSIA